MKRRDFLSAVGLSAAAGGLGFATRSSRVAALGGRKMTKWKSLDYGTDLIWAVGQWSNPVTVGNAPMARLRYRRDDGVFQAQIKVVIGSSTTFPAAAPSPGLDVWFFQLPDDVAWIPGASLDPYTNVNAVAPAPMNGLGVAHIRNWSGSSLIYPGIAVVEPNRDPNLIGTPHACIRVVVGSATMTNLSATNPFTWAATDMLLVSLTCEAFDN